MTDLDRYLTNQRSALPDCDGSTEADYAKPSMRSIPKPGEIVTLRIDAGDGLGPVHDTVPWDGLYVQRIDWEERVVYLGDRPKEKGPVGQVSTPLDGPQMKDWD
jgi:hypothetical protein